MLLKVLQPQPAPARTCRSCSPQIPQHHPAAMVGGGLAGGASGLIFLRIKSLKAAPESGRKQWTKKISRAPVGFGGTGTPRGGCSIRQLKNPILTRVGCGLPCPRRTGAELIARGKAGDARDKETEYITQPTRSHSPAQIHHMHK